jgi:hypothetical protein
VAFVTGRKHHHVQMKESEDQGSVTEMGQRFLPETLFLKPLARTQYLKCKSTG